jgi:hypothetical protein
VLQRGDAGPRQVVGVDVVGVDVVGRGEHRRAAAEALAGRRPGRSSA